MSPLGRPPDDLAGFPSSPLPLSKPLYRIHRSGRAPWWFSSDFSGRFDLQPPAGTCYLAEQELGAFVEVFRDTALVPELEVETRRLATLFAPRQIRLADCAARRARMFGVTAAIHSGQDYALTQAWAASFAAAGFEGIRFLLSHDPAQRLVGYALFGVAGGADWPVIESARIGRAVLVAARTLFGIRVVPTP